MNRAFGFPVALLVLCASAPIAAAPSAAVEAARAFQFSPRVVWAYACTVIGPDTTRCSQLYVYQQPDLVTGEYQYSIVNLYEAESSAAGYRYRVVYCNVVDKRVPTVRSGSASIPAIELDVESTSCQRESRGLADYSGSISIAGDWMSPDHVETNVGLRTSVTSGVRMVQHCRRIDGETVLAGGFSIGGEYLPFGPSTPEYWSFGAYTASDCVSNSP